MKKLLATLLAIVMLVGSFSMVSFAEEATVAEEGLNATEVVTALVNLIKGKDADATFSVGEVVNTVLSVAKGESKIEVNAGELVDTVIGLLKNDEEEKKAFEIKDVIEIIEAVSNGEGDFNGDGVLDANDLIELIEARVSADSAEDDESTMIVSIVFTVIKVLFNLVSKLFAA